MEEPRFRWTASSHSDVGLIRRINEDACLSLPERQLWAVADGMGGHAFGEVASAMVVDALTTVAAAPVASLDERAEATRLALQVVNHALREQALMHDLSLVGSTVVVMLARQAQCAILWAGDSRAYLLRRGSLRQLTRDHSQAASAGAGVVTPGMGAGVDQDAGSAYGAAVGSGVAMAREAGAATGSGAHPEASADAEGPDAAAVAPPAALLADDDVTWYATLPPSCGLTAGRLIGASARSMPAARETGAASGARQAGSGGITRAVGATDALALDEIRFTVEDGDLFLLCSDGLTREADAGDIARLLAPANRRHAARSLVALALERGGRDNVSVVVIAADDLWSADRTLLNPAC